MRLRGDVATDEVASPQCMTSIEMRWGGSDFTGIDQIREMISQMTIKDGEHPDAWMTHDSGWTLTLHEQGLIIWGNPSESINDRHLVTTDSEIAERLLVLLGEGRISEIEGAITWQPGRGVRPPTAEEIKESEDAMLASYRDWYDKLGAEDSGERCATSGCERGALKRSVMCRRHHFEMIQKVSCPFTD